MRAVACVYSSIYARAGHYVRTAHPPRSCAVRKLSSVRSDRRPAAMEGEDEPKPLLSRAHTAEDHLPIEVKRSPHGMCMKMLVSAAQRGILPTAACCYSLVLQV